MPVSETGGECRMDNGQRRFAFWSLLVSSLLLFIWAANYYAHPLRILLVIGALVVAAFIIRPRISKGK